MVVGSIISIMFIYYCDENKRNKAKLPVILRDEVVQVMKMKKVIFEKSILSCVLIFLICCIARVVEYFGIRTDETILGQYLLVKHVGEKSIGEIKKDLIRKAYVASNMPIQEYVEFLYSECCICGVDCSYVKKENLQILNAIRS